MKPQKPGNTSALACRETGRGCKGPGTIEFSDHVCEVESSERGFLAGLFNRREGPGTGEADLIIEKCPVSSASSFACFS